MTAYNPYVNFFFGTRKGDLLNGGIHTDIIFGFGGADYIDAKEGNDSIYAGRGNDTIVGGPGSDFINGGKGFDTVTYEGGVDDYTIKFPTKPSGKGPVKVITPATEDVRGTTDKLTKVEAIYFAADDYTYYLDGTNNAVLARDDFAVTDEDSPLTLDVAELLSNDSDFDGDTVTVTGVDALSALGVSVSLSGGQVQYDAGSTFDYLNAGEAVVDTFTYSVDDGFGGTDTAVVSVTINGVNDDPELLGLTSVNITENTTAVTSFAATDVDSTNLKFAIAGGADSALFQIDETSGALSFINAPDFETPGDVGEDNFYQVDVSVSDGDGGSDTQTVTVEVTDVYEAPMLDLVISEIMYNPASSEDDWEWVEVTNTGSEAIDMAGFVIDDINSVAHDGANIAAGSIAAGESAILYNADDITAEQFEAAWGEGINLIAVSGWSAMGLNNGGDTVGIWADAAAYAGDHTVHANTVVSVAYDDSGAWPADDGFASIYLTDLAADASDGANWALSTDGGATPVNTGETSVAAGGNSGSDVGSPGGVTLVPALISEFSPNPNGADPTTQFLELSGEAGRTFTGVFVSIESDAGSPGAVDAVEQISGIFDANGLLTVEISDVENPSNTLVLLSSFSGTVGTDIDTNDDGTADDLSTFGTVFDAIGVPDNVGDESFVYGAQLGGSDFSYTGDEPQLIFRDGSVGDWYAVNDPAGSSVFDIDGLDVTAAIFDTDPTAGSSFMAINPSVTDEEPVTLVINEVDADTAGADTLEFVEIFDGGAGNTALDGYVLVFFNGADDSSYAAFDLDGYSTDENGFFVAGNPDVANVDLTFAPGSGGALQNGADAVALYLGDASDFPNDTLVTGVNLVDAVVYDTNDGDDAGLLAPLGQSVQYNEDAAGDKDNHSNSRVPDGTGTFVAQAPTPGESNSPGGSLFIESFEEAPGSGYSLSGAFDDTGFDFFGRYAVPDTSNGARDDFTGPFDGDFAIMGQDHDGDGEAATQVVTLTDIDISGVTDPAMSLLLGALSSEPNFLNYEAADGDGVEIFATVDGGDRMLIGAFKPPAGGVGDLRLDTTGDGIGDGAALGTELAEFVFEIPQTGAALTLEIEMTSTDNFEPLALDRVAVGEAADLPIGDGGGTGGTPTEMFISEIQGSGTETAHAGTLVTVSAIVTGDFQNGDADDLRNLNGFFLQEEDTDADADAGTSEGIFVYDGSFLTDVNVGDLVTVTGTVSEFNGETQITASAVEVMSSGNSAPTAASVALPTAGVMVDANGDYVPDLEAYEGMLVNFAQTLTVNEMFNMDRFNEIRLTAGDRPEQFTQSNDPDVAGYDAYLQDIGADQIIFDDGLSVQNAAILPEADLNGDGSFNTADGFSMGDTITGLTGVLSYQWAGNASSGSTWRVRSVEDDVNVFVDTQERQDTPPDVGGTLTAVSFNVLNFFNTLDNGGTTDLGFGPRGADTAEEYGRQLDKLVVALAEMEADVYGLVELENQFAEGVGDNAISSLVAELNASFTDGTIYDWVRPGADHVGDDAIAVGMIYKTNTVSVDLSSVEILDDSDLDALGFGALDDDGLGVFNGASTNRSPLAATFTDLGTGEEFTVAVTHMKSKGSGSDSNADLNDGAGASNEMRSEGVEVLQSWLDSFADEDRLVLGDFNAYAAEDPIDLMLADGYTNLEESFNPGATTYVFDGQTGTLDYAFGSADIMNNVTGAEAWNINSPEPDVFDYNEDFGRDTTIYDGTEPYRTSDHDPILIGLDFTDDVLPLV